MKYFNYLLFLLSSFIIQSRGTSQNLFISGDFGVSCQTNSFANGYGFNINTFFLNSGKHHFGIILGNNFMSSSHLLPGKNLEANHFNIRDYTNLHPLGEGFTLYWSKDAFEPIKLQIQPNRYYNFNIGINYFYNFLKFNYLKIGSELILTLRDQMEIDKILDVKELQTLFQSDEIIYDYHIPIYSYDTYLDLGIAPYIQYNIFSYKRLHVGVKTKIYIFPKSGEMIYNFGAVMTWSKTHDNETTINKQVIKNRRKIK